MIPYTAEPRADTGVTNVTMGIWLFLASEVMLFGSLFSAYALLRVAAADWPSGRQVLDLRLAGVNTLVLITMTALAWQSRGRADRSAVRLLAASTIAALVFVLIKGFEYWTELGAGLRPSASTFIAMYFTLTGLHAVHVLAGIIANVWTMAGNRHLFNGRVRAVALYWAFVDLVWFVILVLFYLS